MQSGGGDAIRGKVAVTALTGLVACALAVGRITDALVPGNGLVPGNVIGAGHLVLHVNDDRGGDLNIGELTPGRPQHGDQLLTADMAGVGAADLVVTLSGRPAGPFSAQTSLTVYYSDPEPAAGIGSDGDRCRPQAGYRHRVAFANLAMLAHGQRVALGTLTSQNDGVCVRFELELSPQAGDNVQGAAANLAMVYTLQQISAGPS